MTVYLDIGAKRIQAYLARTPRLRGRRGASALLEYKMLHGWTKGAWSQHAEVNDEGKQTDGVLSLRFTAPEADDRTVEAVVTETATLLQRLAPGAEWDVHVRYADSYRQALRDGAAIPAVNGRTERSAGRAVLRGLWPRLGSAYGTGGTRWRGEASVCRLRPPFPGGRAPDRPP